jgi:hypothetical protein
MYTFSRFCKRVVRLLLVCGLLALPSLILSNGATAIAGTRYWVGGTGNWDASTTTHWSETSGGAGGAAVPTFEDAVIFNSASNATAYTVTVTTAANAADITFANPASGALTFAGSSTLNVYGNFAISSAITRNFTGALNFVATSTGKTITANGITFDSTTTFEGVGGGWTLQDAWQTSASFWLKAGSLNTNGKTVTVFGGMYLQAGTTRALTLGASVVTASGGWIAGQDPNGLTIDAGTSIINTPTLSGGDLTYNVVNFDAVNNLSISGTNTFATVTYSGAGPGAGAGETTANMILSDNQIIGTLIINGDSTTDRVLVTSDTIGTPRTLTVNTLLTVTNIDFRDITGAGAISWNLAAITGKSGDAGGNSGITFTPSATQTANGTTSFSWSDVSRWTSRVPLPQDDVIINLPFEADQTILMDMGRSGRNIDFTGTTWTGTLTLDPAGNDQGEGDIFGSLTLVPNMTVLAERYWVFAGRANYTLTTAGIILERSIFLQAPGGTLTLGGNLTLGPTRFLNVYAGTLDVSASNYIISAGSILAQDSTTTINFGSAVHLITGAGTALSVNSDSTLNSGTSIIKFTDTSDTEIYVSGGGKTYNNVWFSRGSSTGDIYIDGANTFADFKDDGTSAHTIYFQEDTIQTFNTFTVSGSAGNLISLDTAWPDVIGTYTLTKAGSGQISSDYLNIQHAIATPANTWYAGVNSVNNQAVSPNGSGWIFSVPVPPTTTTTTTTVPATTTTTTIPATTTTTIIIPNTSTTTPATIPETTTTTIAPLGIPSAPFGVTGIPGNRRVVLHWEAPIDSGDTPIVDYVVEYTIDGGRSWDSIRTGQSARTRAVLVNLQNGQPYKFRVIAVNDSGQSDPSSASARIIPRAPALPPVVQTTTTTTTVAISVPTTVLESGTTSTVTTVLSSTSTSVANNISTTTIPVIVITVTNSTVIETMTTTIIRTCVLAAGGQKCTTRTQQRRLVNYGFSAHSFIDSRR